MCAWEQQTLNCTGKGKIVILSANYGHKDETRCNNAKSENTNCFSENDVRSVVKVRCEHRNACLLELHVPDKELDNMTLSTCPISHFKTLEIVYECMSSKFFCCNFIPCSVVSHISQRSIIIIESKLN